MRAPRGGPLPAPMPGGYRCYNPSVCALLLVSPRYVSNRQIHEDLGVPLFADHIRALTASFDSKIADVGKPLVRQLGRYLRWPRVDPVAWRESQGRLGPAGQSRPSPAMAKSTKLSRSAPISRAPFGYPDWGFPWFSSVVRQMPGYTMPKGLEKSHSPSLRLSQSGLRTQTANQAKFIPLLINPVPPRQDQSRPSAWLQNR